MTPKRGPRRARRAGRGRQRKGRRAPRAPAAGLWLGLDLGGTNIKAALVDGDGMLLARDSTETRAEEGPEAVLGRMARLARSLAEREGAAARVAGLGVGSPGPLDSQRGVVVHTPNLPGWQEVRVTDALTGATGWRSILEGDANVAGFAEYRLGAGRGTRTMVLLTLGTGVGGAVVLDGELVRGVDDTGGHLGHICVDADGPECGCGARGCIEAFASAPNTVRRFREAAARGEASALADSEELTTEDIARAAAGGDALARSVLAETGRLLGVVLGSVANAINPEVAVVGGGLANAGELLFGPMREAVLAHSLPAPGRRLRLVPPALEEPGAIGAALLARERLR